MEHRSRSEATIPNLLAEFASLERIAVEMGKIGDKRIDTWLEDVKSREGDINEIKKEATEINDARDSKDSPRRVNNNMKVIQSVKAVKALKERPVEIFLGGIPEEKLKRFSDDDRISFTSQPLHEIGSGSFAKVYKGRLENSVQVAIKILKRRDDTEEVFMSEVSTMLKASHPNIIQLYGFCSNGNVKALVYEFMEKGSLDVLLSDNPYSVEWGIMYRMAIEIGKALAHLHHGCKDQIIHHDIKPSNVLLDLNHSPKVADFGTTRIMNRDMNHFTVTHLRGTFGYIAPEIGMPSTHATYKCDVFSFGQVLFDILGMRNSTKFRHSLPKQVWDNFNEGNLDVTIKECGFEVKDMKRARILSMVALWCIQHTPNARPSMMDVVSALEEKIKVKKPPNPFFVCDGDFSMRESLSASKGNVSAQKAVSLSTRERWYTYLNSAFKKGAGPKRKTSSCVSNSQAHRIPVRTGIENPSRLAENWAKLSKEMEALKRFRDEVACKKAQQMASWLEKVKAKVEEFEALLSEFNEFKNGSLSARDRINRKVIDLLKSVFVLIEVANEVSELIKLLISDLTGEKPKQFTPENLKSFTSNFSTTIDGHRNGNVYKGQLPNTVKIVVKKLAEEDAVEEIFKAEVFAMYMTSHRNLVKLYGFCFERNMKALVFEYMPNGSLDRILFDYHHKDMAWEKLYEIATETAKGLTYLHDGCDDQLLHRDLKASNILLDSNMCPKVTNFGVSKRMSRDETHLTMSKVRGDPSYAAPEIMQSARITHKCDVYSFGMVLFEILGKRRNIQGRVFFPKIIWDKFEKKEVEEILKECGIAEKNKEKAMILCMVAFWCIQYTPQNRPSINIVVKMLEKEIKVVMPPNPFVPSVPYSVKPFVDVVYEF